MCLWTQCVNATISQRNERLNFFEQNLFIDSFLRNSIGEKQHGIQLEKMRGEGTVLRECRYSRPAIAVADTMQWVLGVWEEQASKLVVWGGAEKRDSWRPPKKKTAGMSWQPQPNSSFPSSSSSSLLSFSSSSSSKLLSSSSYWWLFYGPGCKVV